MSTENANEKDRLRSMIGDLQEQIYALRLFDKTSEINSHCDDLIGQVTLSVESAIDHLNQLQASMIAEINSYREGLLVDVNDRTGKLEKKLDKLASEVEAFNATATSYLTKRRKVTDALQEADALKKRAHELKKSMRNQTFDGSFMRFIQGNQQLDACIGTLELTRRDVEDEIVVKHVVLDETISGAKAYDAVSAKSASGFNTVNAMLCLQDGNLAIARTDRHLLIWSLEHGKKLFDMKSGPMRDCINALAQLPDGRLASGDSEGNIDLWDLKSKKHIKTLDHVEKDVISLGVLSNGSLVAFCEWIYVWSPSALNQPGALKYLGYSHVEGRLELQPYEFYEYHEEIEAWNRLKQRDENYLNKHMKLYRYNDRWDCDDTDSEEWLEVDFEVLADDSLALCFIRPEGLTMSVVSSSARERKPLKEFKMPGNDIKSCSLLPSGDAVLCRSNGSVEIYSLEDGKMYQTFKNEHGPIVAIRQQAKNQLLFVHLPNPDLPILVRNDDERDDDCQLVSSTCFSDDGQYLVMGTVYERFVIWPLRD